MNAMKLPALACLVLLLSGALPAWAVVVPAPDQPAAPTAAADAATADPGPCRRDCSSPVEHCASEVREACIKLKYTPRRGCISHLPLAPRDSCACPVELPCTCHKPLAPLTPCPEAIFREPVCHKPLTPAYPAEVCGCAGECGD